MLMRLLEMLPVNINQSTQSNVKRAYTELNEILRVFLLCKLKNRWSKQTYFEFEPISILSMLSISVTIIIRA